MLSSVGRKLLSSVDGATPVATAPEYALSNVADSCVGKKTGDENTKPEYKEAKRCHLTQSRMGGVRVMVVSFRASGGSGDARILDSMPTTVC